MIDCVSGTFNVILGHGHSEVMATLRSEDDDNLVFASSMFQTPETNRLMRDLISIAPDNLTRVNLRSSGGSTANEGAIKSAQLKTGRSGVFSPFRSHLGQTIRMSEYNGFSDQRKHLPDLVARATNFPDPYCRRCFYREVPSNCGFLCIERISEFIEYSSAGLPACLIMEPISGVGGNIIPPDGYLPRIEKFCRENEIILILDENQTGLGRTGALFASHLFGVKPHMITVSKGLSGVGLPLAAILMEEDLAVMDRSQHGYTFGSLNLAARAALKTLEIIQRPGFLENVRYVGSLLLAGLNDIARTSPVRIEPRGVGLMLGIEVCDSEGGKSPSAARALHAAMLKQGLITRVSEHGRGNVIELRPALILTPLECEQILSRFKQAVSQVSE